MQNEELHAYGLCGLKPEEFDRLTLPEYQSLLEAAYWKEARQIKLLASALAHLLSPYLEHPTPIPFLVDDLLGGDPVAEVERTRTLRLAAYRDAEEHS